MSENECENDNTIVHNITTDEGKIQLTTFEKDDKKFVRIDTEKSITIPLEILSEYISDVDNSQAKYYLEQKQVLDIMTIAICVYMFTIVSVGIWFYYILEGVAKIEL